MVTPFPFLISVDLNQNELLRAVLQNAAAHPNTPTPKGGQLYYNTADNKPYYFNGTEWIDFYGGIEQITAGKGLSLDASTPLGTEANVIIHAEVDGASLYIDPDSNAGSIKVKPGGILTTHIANENVTTLKIADKGVTFAKIQDINTMTVIGRVAAGAGVSSELSIQTVIDNEDDTSLVTEGAVFRFVNASITALGALQGDWDASGSLFPSTRPPEGTGDDIQSGDYWYITVAGTMGTHDVNVGDVLYAKVTAPGQTGTNWFVVETNRDQASETVLGIARVATNAQVVTGTDDLTIVTPLKLAHKLANWYASTGISAEVFTVVGDGITTEFPKSHNFNNNFVIVEVIDATSLVTVRAGVERTSANTVSIGFNVAPIIGQDYLVVIAGKNNTITYTP